MNWAAKRFWKDATVEEVTGGFTVRLDGRGVKTPAKAELVVPTQAMAQASADEWQAQDETIDPGTMPVTRSVNAAIDKVAVQFTEVADMLAAYGDSDLTCYRAASPAGLVARQNEAWDPLLDWAGETFQARLIPVHDLISLSGSLIIGLAARAAFLSPDILWERSRLDEIWQIEQWGADEEAEEMAAVKRQSFLDAHRFLTLSKL